MTRSFNKPALYRGTDGVMRTLAQTAEHMGITVEELRAKWFGTTVQHVRDDRKYYIAVRRRMADERRGR